MFTTKSLTALATTLLLTVLCLGQPALDAGPAMDPNGRVLGIDQNL